MSSQPRGWKLTRTVHETTIDDKSDVLARNEDEEVTGEEGTILEKNLPCTTLKTLSLYGWLVGRSVGRSVGRLVVW